MILYYTGATAFAQPQVDIASSLGGYPSNSPIPNMRIGNLFAGISKKAVQGDLLETKMIALLNTTGATITNLKIYSVTPEGVLFKIKIAAVSPATDTCSKPIFELIQDSESLPFQATVEAHEGVENAIDVATLANNTYIGIWIQRVIEEDKFPQLDEDNTSLTCAELAALLQDPSSSDSQVELVLSW